MSARDLPAYCRVLGTFIRNSLMRDMSFRTNFVIESIASTSWIAMNFGFYLLIFHYTPAIGQGTGWGKYEFFIFLATTMFVNSLVQAFFMPNAQEFSELIRTGNLDFALLKPIDTQFLISCQRVDWSVLSNMLLGFLLLVYSVWQIVHRADDPVMLSWVAVGVYPLYIVCGVAILYSLMIALAATSIWLGRNQTLYDFWFYITNFSRYPMEIYDGPIMTPLRLVFTYLIPVLIVVNVPARLLASPLSARGEYAWVLPAFTLAATVVSLWVSRLIFQSALSSYRSASS